MGEKDLCLNRALPSDARLAKPACSDSAILVLLPFLPQGAFQGPDRLFDAVHAGVEAVSGAERLEGRPRLVQAHVALGQADLGAKVVWVELEHALAVGDGLLQLAGLEEE